MLKILQAWLQQYVNGELPDVQAGFRKGRGTRDQIANIHRIMFRVLFCFAGLWAMLCSLLDLSSVTRDRIFDPCDGIMES